MKNLLLAVLVLLSAVLPAQVSNTGPKVDPYAVERTINCLWEVYFPGDKRPEIRNHREYIKNRFIQRLYKETPIDYSALWWEIQLSRDDYIDTIWQHELFEITLPEIAAEIMRSRQ